MSDGIIAQYPKKYARVVAHRANDQHGGADMSIVTEKRCTKCGELKSVDNFVKDPQKKDGLYSSCKQCYKVAYSKNLDYQHSRCNEYKTNNRDKVLSKKKESWWANRDSNLLKLKEYQERNKDKGVEYRQKNREKINAASALWSFLNKDKRNAATRAWRRSHPGEVKAQKQNRRARENGGTITGEEWISLLEKYGNKCLCCGRSDVSLTLDHVIPLAMGGLNTIDNAQPLCKSCNSRKGARRTTDYRKLETQ